MRNTLAYISQFCEKIGSIKVKNINPKGMCDVIVSVYNGEFNTKEILTITMEFIIDEDWVVLIGFPEELLDDDDYNFICEEIVYELEL